MKKSLKTIQKKITLVLELNVIVEVKIAKELSKYKQGKGSVQFPLDQPMPYELIAQIVAFRVFENLEKGKTKKK